MKILIADDDFVSVKILQLALQNEGHEVVVTKSGLEAWNTFDASPVRVIISDWLMPGLDGPELVHRVRARTNTD